jgi:hypothetical protein
MWHRRPRLCCGDSDPYFDENAAVDRMTPLSRRDVYLLIGAFVTGIGIRLWLLTTSVGSSDALYVTMWANLAAQRGIAGAYAFSPWVNHPPLSLGIMAIVARLAHATSATVPDLFRGLQIVSDIASATMLLFIGRRLGRGIELAVLYLLTPAAMFITGFHCNSDPTMVAFIIAAVLAITTGWPAVAAVMLALSVSIKVVPLLLVPLFALAAGRRFFRFCLSFGVASSLLFLPGLIAAGRLMFRNVFGYAGMAGEWGIPAALMFGHPRTSVMWKIAASYARYGKWLVVVVILLLLAELLRRRGAVTPADVLRGVPLITLLLLFLAPGFGVQYLIWPLPFLPLLISRRSYLLVAGICSAFLFYTYTVWSDGFPWWFADADKHAPGTLQYIVFALITWAILGVTAIGCIRRFLRSGEIEATPKPAP